MWMTLFWVFVGVVGAVAFSLALAYILRAQRLHTQIFLLRQIIRRSRSPWAAEDHAWQRLGEAVQQIPEDLVSRENE